MEILISNKAKKQFEDLPKPTQDNIRDLFQKLLLDGLGANIDIKKLRGYENHYRVRLGKYRIRLEFEKPDTFKIYWVGKRSKAYQD